MDLFSIVNGFDWDRGNFYKNWEKHRVSFLECEQVFFNEPVMVEGKTHSEGELRYYALGRTDEGRRLLVAFTIRRAKIRVVSARDMARKERRRYHEAIEKDSEIQ